MSGFRSRFTKPTTLPEWFGTILDPGTAKKIAGWLDKEVVPFEWLNWFFNLVYQMVRYLRVTGEDASTEDFIVSQTTPTSSVLIGAGRIRKFDINLDVAQQTQIWPAAPTPVGDRRIDVLTLNGFGNPIVIQGAEVTYPVLPVPPLYAGQFPIAEILLNGHATTVPQITQAEIVSITRVGTTATVTTAVAHGYVASDAIYIFGADQPQYNGLFNIDSATTLTFTYTVSGSPITPATGTMIATTIKDVRGFLSNTEGTPTIDLAVVERYDISNSIGPLVNIVWPWAAPVKLTNPGTTPTGTGYGIAWSPGNEFLAVGHFASPWLTIYHREGQEFKKLANPAVLPTGEGHKLAFSLNGEFLAIAHDLSPFVTIYQRDGNTFTKLDNPATPPTGDAFSVAWSPNGKYLAVGNSGVTPLTIYERNGTTFTKLANPATLPTGSVNSLAWSADGLFLAAAHNTTPFVSIYKRQGNTFVKIVGLTPPSGTGYGAAFTPNGSHLVISHLGSPYVTVYERSGSVYQDSAATFSASPGSDSTDVAYSPNGKYLAVAHLLPPFVTIYERDGDAYTKLNDPLTPLAADSYALAFNPNGEFLAVAHNDPSFVYLTIYQTTGVFPSEYVNLRALAPVKS